MFFLKRIKDKFYYYFAEKNWGVQREYGPYVDAHREEHIKQPWKHWWLLVRLNWHYRVLRKTSVLIIHNNKKKANHPYVGAESTVSKRPAPHHFVKSLLTYDVISFDVFDTLILRPLADPKDLFIMVGEKLNCLGFERIRRDAQRLAREKALQLNGSTEMTIEEIYEQVEQLTGIPREKGIAAELEIELELCFANPYMSRVYKILRAQGKRIIIVSDMYLSKEMIDSILKKNGFGEFEKIFVSCEYRKNKHSGDLYNEVLAYLGSGTSVVHIGDNHASDIRSANRKGITTKFYKNCHTVGNQFRATGMSPLIGSAYAGVINTALHNGLKRVSPQYEYGFIYGGIYILGFMNWVHKYAVTHDVERILFLARDGYVYQKAYEMMFNDISCEYVYWSRMANIKSTAGFQRDEFIRRNTFHRVNQGTTVKTMLKSIDLEILENALPKDIEPNDLISKENAPKLRDFLIENWSRIVEMYKGGAAIAEQYFLNLTAGVKNVAVVEVGWVGTGMMGIKKIVEKVKPECTVHCLSASCACSGNKENIIPVLKEELSAYMFSWVDNTALARLHRGKNATSNTMCFEAFTQAPYPSFSGFRFTHENNKVNMEFIPPAVENNKITNSIVEGELDFISSYLKRFRRESYMLNISGTDAYLPFSFAMKHPRYIKKVIGSFIESNALGAETNLSASKPISKYLVK